MRSFAEEQLRPAGHEVTLFNRGQSNPDLFEGEVETLIGNRDGGLGVLDGRSFTAVIDTCGYIPRLVRDSATRLKDAIEHYTFISTLSVYSDNSTPGQNEESPLGTLEDETVEEVTGETYGPLKVLCEQAASEVMGAAHALHIRAGLIVGPHDLSDRFTYWPARLARGGEVLCPGPIDNPIQYIDVRDLADFIIDTIDDSHTGIYNALGPSHEHTMADLIHGCRAATTSDARCTWVDWQYAVQHGVGPWMEMPLWLPPDGNSDGFSRVKNEKAISVGLKFRPLAETIRDTLAWSRTRPGDHRWGAGITAEKEARVLAAWHDRKPTTQPG
mgnify:CR=1 FL=1